MYSLTGNYYCISEMFFYVSSHGQNKIWKGWVERERLTGLKSLDTVVFGKPQTNFSICKKDQEPCLQLLSFMPA